MTMIRLALAGVLVGALGLGLTGCGKKAPEPAPAPPPPPAPAAPPAPPPPPAPAPAPAPEKPLSEEEIFARKSLEELNAERPLADVFFALDQSALTDEARTKLQGNADWLRKWGNTRITIEGHCDNRGTTEYNLALGERRSQAAKEYLVSLGVSADRVLTISKGEETPFCTQDTEDCWAQNRRGHFIITAK